VPDTVERILGAMRWRSGTGTNFLLRQILSPRTDFEAQLSVDSGFLKSLGLIHIQSIAITTGITAQIPSHTLLQNAIIRTGRTVFLVHILHGFACLAHVSSSIAKRDAIFCSFVT
jgi:hypothetical protein